MSDEGAVGSTSADTVRLRLDFAYDGSHFAGWAAQPGLRTVEAELAAGLCRILRRDALRLTTAGRTDAGVHAVGAVCHVDVPRPAYLALPGHGDRPPGEAAVRRLRGVLPPDIVVRHVAIAADGFDARFSASWRRYRYRLCDQPHLMDPVQRNAIAIWPHELDVDRLNAASAELVGLRDFVAFCRRRAGATTVRTLLDFDWRRDDDGVLEARVRADAFCHLMVRSLVGAVVPVGEGRRELGWLRGIRDAGERDGAVRIMAPHGLTLMEVAYPENESLAVRARQARAQRELPGLATTTG